MGFFALADITAVLVGFKSVCTVHSAHDFGASVLFGANSVSIRIKIMGETATTIVSGTSGGFRAFSRRANARGARIGVTINKRSVWWTLLAVLGQGQSNKAE